MNKFLKKMLATSATILVMGQLAPAFSTTLKEAYLDNNDPTARQAAAADLVQSLKDLELENIQLKTPANGIVKEYEDFKKAKTLALSEKADFETQRNAKQQELDAKLLEIKGIEESDEYKFDEIANKPVNNKVDLEQKLVDLQAANKALSDKAAFATLLRTGSAQDKLDAEEELKKVGLEPTTDPNDVLTEDESDALNAFAEAEADLKTKINNAQANFDQAEADYKIALQNKQTAIDKKAAFELQAEKLAKDVKAFDAQIQAKQDEADAAQGEMDGREEAYTKAKAAIPAPADLTANKVQSFLAQDDADYQALLQNYTKQVKLFKIVEASETQTKAKATAYYNFFESNLGFAGKTSTIEKSLVAGDRDSVYDMIIAKVGGAGAGNAGDNSAVVAKLEAEKADLLRANTNLQTQATSAHQQAEAYKETLTKQEETFKKAWEESNKEVSEIKALYDAIMRTANRKDLTKAESAEIMTKMVNLGAFIEEKLNKPMPSVPTPPKSSDSSDDKKPEDDTPTPSRVLSVPFDVAHLVKLNEDGTLSYVSDLGNQKFINIAKAFADKAGLKISNLS